jgi:hypothetical protein
MAEGNHDHEQHEIPSHVHLLSIGGRFFVGSCTRENIAMQAISDSTATRMNILCDGGESRENVCEQARRQIVVDEDYHLPRREREQDFMGMVLSCPDYRQTLVAH